MAGCLRRCFDGVPAKPRGYDWDVMTHLGYDWGNGWGSLRRWVFKFPLVLPPCFFGGPLSTSKRMNSLRHCTRMAHTSDRTLQFVEIFLNRYWNVDSPAVLTDEMLKIDSFPASMWASSAEKTTWQCFTINFHLPFCVIKIGQAGKPNHVYSLLIFPARKVASNCRVDD